MLTLAILRLIYFDYLSWATGGGGMIIYTHASISRQKLNQSITVSSHAVTPLHFTAVFSGRSSLQKKVSSRICSMLRWLCENHEPDLIDVLDLHNLMQHLHL